MRLVPMLVCALAGCYRPAPQVGARCAEGNICPRGLLCRDGICVDENAPAIDAPPIVDAPRIVDAPPDAIDTVGCSDGAREAFVDQTAFPTIAGCAAAWNGPASMRAAATGQACGDDIQLCAVPADACAPGWHPCGSNGQPSELVARADEAACASAGGATIANARFAAALSHCSAYVKATCNYDLPLPCPDANDCGEPICCGAGCRTDAGCPVGAYTMTRIAGTTENGCATMLAADVTGVLCCR